MGFTRSMNACRWALGVALTIVATSPRLASAQESGVAEAQALAKASPSSAEASLGFGRALRRAGREADALAELRRGLAVSGGRGEIATRLQWDVARTYIARREFEPAMASCRAMTKMRLAAGADVTSHVCAAEAHLLWRRGTEAAAEVAEVGKAKSPSLEAQYFAKAVSGRALELASKDAEAEAAYRDAITLAAARPDAHVLLGSLLRRTGRDALPSLRKAVELDPRDPVAQLELGRALVVGSAESLAALDRAVAERPTFIDALRALVDGYVAARRLPEAKRTVEAVLKLAPNDVASHVVAGRVALAEGRPDEAIKEGEIASKLMPNDGPSRLLVADGWARKGEIDLAVEAYQAAFGLDHSDPAPLVNAAQACLAAGRITSAKAFGLRATKDFATHAAAWTALGDALAADRDVPGARAAYENARKTKGADPAAIDRKISTLK